MACSPGGLSRRTLSPQISNRRSRQREEADHYGPRSSPPPHVGGYGINLQQFFGDLDRVEGRAFQQLIAGNPEARPLSIAQSSRMRPTAQSYCSAM